MADGDGPVLEAWLTSPKTSGRKVDVNVILTTECITWATENRKHNVTVNLCDVLVARFVDEASPTSRHEGHASLVIHYVKHVTHKHRRNLSHRCEIFHGSASVCKQWRDKLNDILLMKFPERPKRLLVFVNPVSGKKSGPKVFHSQAEPLFSLCQVTVDLVVTTHAHHTEEVIASYDLGKVNGIVTVGGDGTYAEAVNGLAHRMMLEAHQDENDPDLDLKPLPLPVGIIPTGTGDGIVEVANTTKDIVTAVLLIILGGKLDKDLATVHHGRKLLVYSVLLTGTGLFSEIIRKAESNRSLGRARYVYGVLYGIIKHQVIQVEVDYLPVSESSRDEAVKENSTGETVSGWQHKSGSFVRVDNLTYSASRSPLPDREALGDGVLRLYFVRPCGRISHGVYVKKWLKGDPDVVNSTIAVEVKVKAYRVRAVGEWRTSPQSHIINVDGEIVNLPEPDFSVRCHKGVSQLFSWPLDSIPLSSSLAATAHGREESSASSFAQGANSQEP
ncbi:ceramide kinase-like isoform X2 [Liolophura sinensis]|uniref:ceramide kinase-like isoform X2 n=1 Tax=Liolophura sinensis TaxID=3198878 RepID=UPI0031595653